MTILADMIVEDRAARRRAFPYGATAMGNMDFCTPSISEGEKRVNLVSLDNGNRTYWITADEYQELRKHPFRQVGLWSFVPESDAAADLIADAHRHPESVARELHRLREQSARFKSALESIAMNTCCDQCQEAALVAQVALAPQSNIHEREGK